MKLPPDSVIAPEKIVRCLLVRQDRWDEAGFLERGGFSQTNPEALLAG
jgi:hypothetical protein